MSWTASAAGTDGIVAQGWLGSPATAGDGQGAGADHRRGGRDGRVGDAQLLAGDERRPTRTSSTPTASGGPGATLATLDTTVLRNGTYIIDLTGTDDHGNQQDNEILVTVAGDYKPGRVVVDTDGVHGRARPACRSRSGAATTASNKDKVGDFGNGWSLEIGHPDLQVDPVHDVTITMPERPPGDVPLRATAGRGRRRSSSGSSPTRSTSPSRASSGR